MIEHSLSITKLHQEKNIFKHLQILSLSILLSFILISCDQSEKPAIGSEDEIYVVADSLEFENLKGHSPEPLKN